MLDAAEAVLEFVQGRTFRDYLNNRMLRGAVERHIEIIGEAARKVSTPFQEAHPEIPWRKIITQRHVLAYEYGEIKHELVWRVVTIHIPDLVKKLEALIPPPPPEADS
jgi:uncharacterized protein with HEPN domain